MAIPDFQTLMLPFIQEISDGKIHRIRDVKANLAKRFKLSDEDLKELLPSGRAKLYDNRIGWCNTYLKKAGLVSSTQKGYLSITDAGKKLLEENLQRISVSVLKRFEAFAEFHSMKGTEKPKAGDDKEEPEIIEKSPEELIESAFDSMKNDLARDLLETIKTCSPGFFEDLVVDLITKMGYGGSRKDAGKAIGKSGDGGIDGIINEDKLGLDSIYIQAKRWDNAVPVKEIRDFAGSLLSKKARKGIFITTSGFPKSAFEFTSSIEPKIILIDGNRLASLMIEYEVGVSTKTTYAVKQIDQDYFEEE